MDDQPHAALLLIQPARGTFADQEICLEREKRVRLGSWRLPRHTLRFLDKVHDVSAESSLMNIAGLFPYMLLCECHCSRHCHTLACSHPCWTATFGSTCFYNAVLDWQTFGGAAFRRLLFWMCLSSLQWNNSLSASFCFDIAYKTETHNDIQSNK